MALDDLLGSLEREAEARIAALLDQARAAADAERAGAAERVAGRRAAAVAARRAELEAATGRELDAARQESVRLVLEARADSLARIRARALELLETRRQDASLAPLLADDLRQAAGYLDGAGAVAIVPPATAGALAGCSGLPAILIAPDPDAPAGALIRARDGSLDVDATLAGRLARGWPRLAIGLARALEENR